MIKKNGKLHLIAIMKFARITILKSALSFYEIKQYENLRKIEEDYQNAYCFKRRQASIKNYFLTTDYFKLC